MVMVMVADGGADVLFDVAAILSKRVFIELFVEFCDFFLELTDLTLQTHLVAVAGLGFLLQITQGMVDRHLVDVHRKEGTEYKTCLD